MRHSDSRRRHEISSFMREDYGHTYALLMYFMELGNVAPTVAFLQFHEIICTHRNLLANRAFWVARTLFRGF